MCDALWPTLPTVRSWPVCSAAPSSRSRHQWSWRPSASLQHMVTTHLLYGLLTTCKHSVVDSAKLIWQLWSTKKLHDQDSKISEIFLKQLLNSITHLSPKCINFSLIFMMLSSNSLNPVVRPSVPPSVLQNHLWAQRALLLQPKTGALCRSYIS